MIKKLFLVAGLCMASFTIVFSQIKPQTPKTTVAKDSTKQKNDSIQTKLLDDAKDQVMANNAVVSLDDNDFADNGNQNVSSLLTAGRDAFFSAASFNFNPTRFRIRGYDGELFATFMNGVPMDNLDNGFTPFGLWGGLNDVMRNRDLSIGLRPATFTIGDIGSSTMIDARASKQRKQTEIGYAYSNRATQHRMDITHSTGLSKKGWAFSFSGTRRYAAEGYTPGTYFDSWSWFVGIDKKLNDKQLLSLVVFGTPTESGRQGTAMQEIFDLLGTNYYNPNWGWQNGKKRNANVARTNQPVAILTHDYRINNATNLMTAASFSFGERSSSGLDWYNAFNPSPIYYRNLPSFQQDPRLAQMAANDWKNNPNASQIDWHRLYDFNRNNNETFNGVSGKRSRFILGEFVTNTTRFNINSVLNTRAGERTELTFGASYQFQKNKNFKRVNDLLGGDYFVDLAQFAERQFPNSPLANQPNVNTPNRIVRVGDDYNYNYDITISRAAAWGQAVVKFNNMDYFVALEISNTSFFRTGNYKNGLFLNNSFGESPKQNFSNYNLKTGFTFKLDGRNYLYANVGMLTKAPFFDNVYVSPRTRNTTQNNVTNEEIRTLEGGYVLNAPRLKIRATGYYTEFRNQMNVLSFFHDQYQNLVNYGLTNINKAHMGLEFGAEFKLTSALSINAAANIGKYIYTSRMRSSTTLDNTSEILREDSIYSKDYRVGGTPQEAYNIGLFYRSPKFWFVSVNFNYFDQNYLEINPIRRTQQAVSNVAYQSAEWNKILNQQRFAAQSTLDVFAGYSWKLPKRWEINNRNTFLVFNFSINNVLNNQNIIQGGFEQLRYDFRTNDADRFPARFSYAFGINYQASVNLRF